jgi:hypothetical protein
MGGIVFSASVDASSEEALIHAADQGFGFFSPFNNSQRSSPTSLGYTPADHRASWLTDLHAQQPIVHPPGSRHYRARW